MGTQVRLRILSIPWMRLVSSWQSPVSFKAKLSVASLMIDCSIVFRLIDLIGIEPGTLQEELRKPPLCDLALQQQDLQTLHLTLSSTLRVP
jgi:hypothetical protein